MFAIGPEVDLTYPVEWLGEDLSALGTLPEAVRDGVERCRAAVVIAGMGAMALDGAYAAARAAAAGFGASFGAAAHGGGAGRRRSISASRTDGGIAAIRAKAAR